MDERDRDPDRQPGSSEPRTPLRHDPAAPHTAPFPTHIPRWIAWGVLIGLAASGAVCVRVVVG